MTTIVTLFSVYPLLLAQVLPIAALLDKVATSRSR